MLYCFIHDTDPAPPMDTDIDNPIQEITEVDNAVPELSSPDNLYDIKEKPRYYAPLILILISIATALFSLIYYCI
jgi:hypothetical protein